MTCRGFVGTIALLVALSGVGQVQAEGVAMIEDFESYSSAPGSWTKTSSNITVGIGLLNTGAIEGNKDLSQTLGIGLIGATYKVQNLALNVPVPPSATQLKFKMRPLLSLNLGRTLKVTLTDQNSVAHVSPSVNLSLLNLNTVTDFDLNLNAFTPSATGADISALKGISFDYTVTLATVGAEEHLDSIRFTWDNSAVEDWMVY